MADPDPNFPFRSIMFGFVTILMYLLRDFLPAIFQYVDPLGFFIIYLPIIAFFFSARAIYLGIKGIRLYRSADVGCIAGILLGLFGFFLIYKFATHS